MTRSDRQDGSADEIEWLDDETSPGPHYEELPGRDRPPLRRGTRLVLAGVATAAIGTAVVLASTGDGGGTPDTTASRTVAPIRSSERTFALESPLPQTPPRAGLAAIRAVYPRADLTGFVAVRSPGTDGSANLIYNLTSGRRLITVSVRPTRPSDREAVNRTATSVEIVQQLGNSNIDALVRVSRGAPSAHDFAAVQQLVNDPRLLSTR